jgi:hypothetical protein
MALSANREVDHYVDQELRTFKVAGSTTIYKGALVGLKSDGYARGLVAGDPYAGISYEKADNNSGSDGDLSVRMYTLGDFEHALAGATIASVGRPVFASADDTLSFTADGNSYVGIVQDVPASGTIILRTDPTRKLIKTVTHAVEDLDAGGDIAARAIHSFNQDAWIVEARVVNQADAAAGIDDSNTCVITLANTAGTVVTETFDSTTTFPAANTAKDLGTLANQHCPKSDALTLAVTNGATANPGPFLIEVDYV